MSASPAGAVGEAYQTLFEHSLDAVFFTAPDGRVFAANPAACKLFGYTEKELCALGREGISDPADRERAAALVARRAATGQLRGVLSYRRRDGTTFPGEFSSMIFTDASGEQRTCVILRDMTEREELEQRLAGQLRQTQAANDELASFTYYVSHDLRAPLRAMDGYSRALLEDYGDRLDDTARDDLHRIRDASQKMGALLHDLLQWSRLGRADLHRVPTDLSALARESADQLQAADPGRHVTFRIADGVAGSADPGLIRTVLDNLLGNAWKYTARQPDPVIEFGATTAPGGPVIYFVADNGSRLRRRLRQQAVRAIPAPPRRRVPRHRPRPGQRPPDSGTPWRPRLGRGRRRPRRDLLLHPRRPSPASHRNDAAVSDLASDSHSAMARPVAAGRLQGRSPSRAGPRRHGHRERRPK